MAMANQLKSHELKLKILNDSYAVVHMPLTTALLPTCPSGARLWSLTVSNIEYSLVVSDAAAAEVKAPGVQINNGWDAYYLEGPIPFDLTGIIARLTAPLGEAKVGCFVISTFDSDFILVKTTDRAVAHSAWQQAGVAIVGDLI